MEFCLRRSLDEIGRPEESFVGDLYLYAPSVSSNSWRIDVVSINENASGQPEIFAELGYNNFATFSQGSNNGIISPPHIWTESGPFFLTAEEKYHSE